jgi:hypothetical protein
MIQQGRQQTIMARSASFQLTLEDGLGEELAARQQQRWRQW